MPDVNPQDLRPGQMLRHVKTGAVVTLDRRKLPHERHPRLPWHPGWWLRDNQGGLADFVITDGTWELIDPPSKCAVHGCPVPANYGDYLHDHPTKGGSCV